MVIKGRARSGALALARHLERTDHNERVTIRELRGVMADTLREALWEMGEIGGHAKSRRVFYHAQINTAPGEILTEAQKLRAVERLEQELGFEGQPRTVVEHVKARKGQDRAEEHMHVVWLRVDVARGIAIHDSHNYRKHEEVSRELEREFGHRHVRGAHIERDGRERPARTPSHAEMQQAQRTGRSVEEDKRAITALWNTAATGREFAAALEQAGWILAQGDRRDFVLLDQHGEPHSLARRIEGAKAAQIRERMGDVDRAQLPTVEQARAWQRERSRAIEHEEAEWQREHDRLTFQLDDPYMLSRELEDQALREQRVENAIADIEARIHERESMAIDLRDMGFPEHEVYDPEIQRRFAPPSPAAGPATRHELEDIAARNREQTAIDRVPEPIPDVVRVRETDVARESISGGQVPAESVRVMDSVGDVAQTVFDAATLKPFRRPAWRMFEAFSRFATGAVEHVAELFAGMFDSRPAAPSQPQGSQPAALPLPPPKLARESPTQSVSKIEPKRSLADELLAEGRQQQAKEDLRDLLKDYENPHEMEMRRKRGPERD